MPSGSSRDFRRIIGHGVEDAGVEAGELGRIEAGRAVRDLVEREDAGDGAPDRGSGSSGRLVPVSTAMMATAIGAVAGLAQLGQRQRAEALGQPLAFGAGEEVVVGEGRDRAAQRLEDLDLRAGIGDVVLAADHVGDAQVDIVDHRGQRCRDRLPSARISTGSDMDAVLTVCGPLIRSSNCTGRPSSLKRQWACCPRPRISPSARVSGCSAARS